MTKVSVIVPCYNEETYLWYCLKSLVHQTMKDLEIIIVNDGSTDGTLEIAEYYQNEYPKKIKIISLEENKGLSHARNVGMSYAQGKTIGFVDGDDMVSLNMYQDFYKNMKKYNVPIVLGKLKRLSMNETDVFFTDNIEPTLYKNEDLEKKIHPSVSCADKLFNHDFIENTKFLEGKLYEDISFTYPLLFKAKEFLSLQRGDYGYRNTPHSIMHQKYSVNENKLDIIDVVVEALKKGQQFNLTEKQMNQMKSYLKMVYCNHVEWIEGWEINHQDKTYIIESLLSIGNFYLSNIEEATKNYLDDYRYRNLELEETLSLRKELRNKITSLK